MPHPAARDAVFDLLAAVFSATRRRLLSPTPGLIDSMCGMWECLAS